MFCKYYYYKYFTVIMEIFACRRAVQVFPIQCAQAFYSPAEAPALLLSYDVWKL